MRLAAAFLLLFSACTNDTPSIEVVAATESPVPVTDLPQWLFVVQADAGRFVERGGETRLEMFGVPEQIVAFTDRPDRQTKTEPTSVFIAKWDAEGFGDDPPNAALTMHDHLDVRKTVVVELFDPAYNAMKDKLAFDVRILEESPENFAHLASAVTDDPVTQFSDASLFIDDLTENDSLNSYCIFSITNWTGATLNFVNEGTSPDSSWIEGPGPSGGVANNAVVDFTLMRETADHITDGFTPCYGSMNLQNDTGNIGMAIQIPEDPNADPKHECDVSNSNLNCQVMVLKYDNRPGINELLQVQYVIGYQAPVDPRKDVSLDTDRAVSDICVSIGDVDLDDEDILPSCISGYVAGYRAYAKKAWAITDFCVNADDIGGCDDGYTRGYTDAQHGIKVTGL